MLAFIFSFLAAPKAFAATINVNLPGASSSPSSPGGWVSNFYQFALLIAGVLAFGVIIYGGVRYMTAVGNPSGEEEAKAWIWAALTGILLLAGAYFILNVINPQLLQLNLPALQAVSTTAGVTLPSGEGPSGGASSIWGCVANNNIVACSPGNKSDCSDVPNGACSGKSCTQFTTSDCGSTVNPADVGNGTCTRVPNGGVTGSCPPAGKTMQNCCYFITTNSSAFCTTMDCKNISPTQGTCQGTANGGTTGICPDNNGKHQSCCPSADIGPHCQVGDKCTP